MMINGHNHSDFRENMQRCRDYIQGLEEERRKIQVFQRELPLCLELVTQAIETCKQQLSGTTTECNNLGECNSEQTSSDVPVFEEFIPIKRASSHSAGEEQDSKKLKNENNKDENHSSKKSDWLRSVQLWNPTPDPLSKEDSTTKFGIAEVKRNGSSGAFHPFKKKKNTVVTVPTRGPMDGPAPPPSTSSTANSGGGSGGNRKEEKESASQRKRRRCWSPELHRRFIQALQHLGGSHEALPCIKKVDGLTNDEVKSHLQKYRLHTRRPSPSTNNNNTQTPQFVVVGGIWVAPEYASVAGTTTSTKASGKGIYAPIAAPPPPFQEPPPSLKQRRQTKRSSQSDDRGSFSEGTSSSTHTTTVSPAS